VARVEQHAERRVVGRIAEPQRRIGVGQHLQGLVLDGDLHAQASSRNSNSPRDPPKADETETFPHQLHPVVPSVEVGFASNQPLVRLFEAMIREREELPTQGLNDIHRTLEQIEGRLHLMEERQSFYEALRAEPDVTKLPAPGEPGDGSEGPTANQPGGSSLPGET